VKTVAVTFEMVEAIAQQVGGGPILDEAGVRSAIGRPFHGSVEEEYYPSLWEKAAVLLHGFATTQYLEDGNKRTAWTLAKLFLLRNGIRLPPVPVIQSEALMQATAAGQFSVERVTEWLHTANGVRADDVYDHRLEYLLLANEAEFDDNSSTMTLVNAGVAGTLTVDVEAALPIQIELMACGRILWGREDDGVKHEVTARFVDHDEDHDTMLVLWEEWCEMSVVPSGHIYQRGGRVPTLFCLPLLPKLSHDGRYEVQLLIDGRIAGTKNYTFQRAAPLPDLSSL
jgi:prophage maintenance system killer protein